MFLPFESNCGLCIAKRSANQTARGGLIRESSAELCTESEGAVSPNVDEVTATNRDSTEGGEERRKTQLNEAISYKGIRQGKISNLELYQTFGKTSG